MKYTLARSAGLAAEWHVSHGFKTLRHALCISVLHSHVIREYSLHLIVPCMCEVTGVSTRVNEGRLAMRHITDLLVGVWSGPISTRK